MRWPGVQIRAAPFLRTHRMCALKMFPFAPWSSLSLGSAGGAHLAHPHEPKAPG
jgi:hypothetical protein